MSILRIISDQVPAAALELQPGVVTIGRREENLLQINHPTVSGRHCELICQDGSVMVKDLGSTNGTFVNDQPVQETLIMPGQVLRLGDIQLAYELPAPAQTRIHLSAPPPEEQPGATDEPAEAIQRPCHKHHQTEGEWICSQCRTLFCEACSNKREADGKIWRACSLCKGKLISIQDYQDRQAAKAARTALTFPQRLPSAFKYPFVKGGILLLIVGTVVYWMVGIAQFIVNVVPFYGWMASAILLTFSWGWLFAYVQKIVVSCSNDEDILPPWPEIAEWSSDLVQPFRLCLMTVGLCFAPAMIYSWWSAKTDSSPFFFYALFGLGLLYFPMALLVVALTGSIKSANPFVVLPAIPKVPRDYSIVCLLFLGALGVWNGFLILFEKTIGFRLVYSLPLGFIFLYCMIVCIRALGMMYRCNRKRFGWFKD